MAKEEQVGFLERERKLRDAIAVAEIALEMGPHHGLCCLVPEALTVLVSEGRLALQRVEGGGAVMVGTSNEAPAQRQEGRPGVETMPGKGEGSDRGAAGRADGLGDYAFSRSLAYQPFLRLELVGLAGKPFPWPTPAAALQAWVELPSAVTASPARWIRLTEMDMAKAIEHFAFLHCLEWQAGDGKRLNHISRETRLTLEVPPWETESGETTSAPALEKWNDHSDPPVHLMPSQVGTIDAVPSDVTAEGYETRRRELWALAGRLASAFIEARGRRLAAGAHPDAVHDDDEITSRSVRMADRLRREVEDLR